MQNENRRLEQELDRLFAAYRDACEAPEPAPDFVPRLWARIEATQSWPERFWMWANRLALAAAAASVMLVVYQVSTQPRVDFYTATYVETLMAQTDAELAPVELAGVAVEPPVEQPQQ
ncbi:MAG: hypothetical protein ACOYX1_03885 [Acidobacteriota bacterium]